MQNKEIPQVDLNKKLERLIIPPFSGMFQKDDIVIIDKKDENIRYAMLGDIKDVYQLLRNEISNKNPRVLDDYVLCLETVIVHYFGNCAYKSKRLRNFPYEYEIEKGKEIGKISDLAHKNMALGIERSMVSQNLLWEIGVETTFKVGLVVINDKIEEHGYNVVSYNNKYYIFDATIPTERDCLPFPIVGEITKEMYEDMINPNSVNNYNIRISHINPLDFKKYDIIYDVGKKEINEIERAYTKKLGVK